MELSYYKCKLFDEKIINHDSFSFIQEEIALKDQTKQNIFEKILVNYSCKFKQNNLQLGSKPIAIICIKDNLKLLQYTLNNLKNNNIFDVLDFIIVDDRSTENLLSVTNLYPVSYLRIDNPKGFNFSNLNNVAAKIAYDFGCKEIVLWNSDLWVHDKQTIVKLLALHRETNSTISGTKLLYPLESWDGNKQIPENIKQNFANNHNNYRGTVQFGGSAFLYTSHNGVYSPIHYRRFCDKQHPYVNCNKPDNFVTGAFQIIDLEWFIKAGGMNPSLSKNFQDVDLCLRAVEQEKTIYYFGKELYLYHDESLSLSKDKFNKQFLSDNILYTKIWNLERFFKVVYSL